MVVINTYFGTGEVTLTKSNRTLRSNLNLVAPLPTSIKMDSTGITAYTTASSNVFARLDYRGLYVQNGAIDIRTSNKAGDSNRGVILDSSGLRGYKNTGTLTFDLDTNGNFKLYGGSFQIWTHYGGSQGIVFDSSGIKGYSSTGTLKFELLSATGDLKLYGGSFQIWTHYGGYQGIVFDSAGVRGYNSSGTNTFNLKSSDGSLSINGGYISITHGGLKETNIESSATNKWNNAEQNAINAAYANTENKFNNSIELINNGDLKIRSDLNLTSKIPTNLRLDSNGITAYTGYLNQITNYSKFARLDHRGLYIQGGAVDIRTNGSSTSSGVVLNSTGLQAYDSNGKATFLLNGTTGSAEFSGRLYVGDTSAYTLIQQNYIENYGVHVRTWGLSGSELSNVNYWLASNPNTSSLNPYKRRVKLTVQNGSIKIRSEKYNDPQGVGTSLYYTDYGISTWENGAGTDTASGVIEFFSRKFQTENSGNKVGLALYSSGNVSLNSSASGGSTIYLNPTNNQTISNSSASVIVGYGDMPYQWTTIKAGKIYVRDDENGSQSWEVASKEYVRQRISAAGSVDLSSYATRSYVDSNYMSKYNNTIGSWILGSTNLKSTNNKINIGGSTGNIVVDGNVTCSKVVERSKRETKKNIEEYNKNATDLINTASIKTYQYTDDVDKLDIPYIGLILDEAPVEVVDTKGEGVLPTSGVWLSWKAIQELSERIEKLEKASVIN